jgi:hypothetical protein
MSDIGNPQLDRAADAVYEWWLTHASEEMHDWLSSQDATDAARELAAVALRAAGVS